MTMEMTMIRLVSKGSYICHLINKVYIFSLNKIIKCRNKFLSTLSFSKRSFYELCHVSNLGPSNPLKIESNGRELRAHFIWLSQHMSIRSRDNRWCSLPFALHRTILTQRLSNSSPTFRNFSANRGSNIAGNWLFSSRVSIERKMILPKHFHVNLEAIQTRIRCPIHSDPTRFRALLTGNRCFLTTRSHQVTTPVQK